MQDTIEEFEYHVCAESLQAGVCLGDCNAENWATLAPDREVLASILWDMTAHGVFGNMRLGDMISGSVEAGERLNLAHAMTVELPDIWAAKLKGGSPAFNSPDFFQWMYDAIAIVLRFCSEMGINEIALMKSVLPI